MGLLVDGEWKDRWYDTKSSGGKFQREAAKFRGWVKRGDADHPAEDPSRYHLYVSYACPWAHRTLIYRKLKKLEAIGVTVVAPHMLESGWDFTDDYPDTLLEKDHLYEVYREARPDFTGRVTVPVLWDKEARTIVNNESSEIIRMMDEELATEGPDLRPEALRAEIDEVNERVYDHINNGVYKCGFATTQEAYDEAVEALFDALDWLEARLEGRRWLVGDQLTEADVRLFTTLVRFDRVYHFHFKCTKRRLRDYPRLWDLTRRMYQTEGVRETVHFGHIVQHYFYSHESINPHRIVPVWADIDFEAPVE